LVTIKVKCIIWRWNDAYWPSRRASERNYTLMWS